MFISVEVTCLAAASEDWPTFAPAPKARSEIMRNWEKFNSGVVEEFRASGGKVRGKGPVLLLTTIGARSGQPRVTPLVYGRNGDDIIIVASRAGERKNPDWYHNLVANPEVTIELGVDQFRARARLTDGEERQRLFDQMVNVMYRFANYQRKTTRVIPVIVLERIP